MRDRVSADDAVFSEPHDRAAHLWLEMLRSHLVAIASINFAANFFCKAGNLRLRTAEAAIMQTTFQIMFLKGGGGWFSRWPNVNAGFCRHSRCTRCIDTRSDGCPKWTDF